MSRSADWPFLWVMAFCECLSFWCCIHHVGLKTTIEQWAWRRPQVFRNCYELLFYTAYWTDVRNYILINSYYFTIILGCGGYGEDDWITFALYIWWLFYFCHLLLRIDCTWTYFPFVLGEGIQTQTKLYYICNNQEVQYIAN